MVQFSRMGSTNLTGYLKDVSPVAIMTTQVKEGHWHLVFPQDVSSFFLPVNSQVGANTWDGSGEGSKWIHP